MLLWQLRGGRSPVGYSPIAELVCWFSRTAVLLAPLLLIALPCSVFHDTNRQPTGPAARGRRIRIASHGRSVGYGHLIGMCAGAERSLSADPKQTDCPPGRLLFDTAVGARRFTWR
jgi:hypothetical protein